nr:MAG: DNA pilot protein [Microviridae sp.]
MASWASYVIPAVMSYLGSQSTNSANAANQQSMLNNSNWTSGTAYQRATADMKAAGLNPMLAYSQGGASTTSTSPIQFQNSLGNASSAGLQGASTAATVKQANASSDNLAASTDLNKAQTEVAKETRDTKQSETQLNSVNTALSSQKFLTEQQNTAAAAARAVQEKAAASSSQSEADLRSASTKNKTAVESGFFGQAMSYIDRLLAPISTAISATRPRAGKGK